MIKHLAIGIYSSTVFIINTIICCTPIVPIALFKLIIPIKGWRFFCTRILHGIAYIWTFLNVKGWIDLQGIEFHITGLDSIIKNKRYLVIANHQSWTDVTILQKLLYTKIPLLTFFIKKELIWIPLLGIAWWALDFPFMKRHSKERLLKKPHLKGADLKQAYLTSKKLKSAPVSIMNFPEGTRFTKEKHDKQGSPFNYLLRPKAGGIAMIISSLKARIDTILDVTIIYPCSQNNFWSLLSGQIKQIYISFEQVPLTPLLFGNYREDKIFRKHFQNWLNKLWEKKDKNITEYFQTIRNSQ